DLDDLLRTVLLVGRQGEGARARGEGVALPLGGVQLVAEGVDALLQRRHRLLGARDRARELGVFRGTRVVALERDQLGPRLLATLLGRRERGALPLQLGVQGAQALLRSAHGTRTTPLLEAVLADERGLGADLVVERVEARAGGRRRGGRPPEHRLRLGVAPREPLRLRERVGDRRL